MKNKITALLENRGENHMLPFFWQHGESEETLREYMRVIHEANCGAVCVESRPHPDFCGDQWWHDMDIILDEARTRNMKVWILDDSHFPTGYANGAMKGKPDSLCRQSIYRQFVQLTGGAKTVRIPMTKLTKPRKQKKSFIATFLGLSNKDLRKFDDDSVISITAVSDTGKRYDITANVQDEILVWDKPDGRWVVTYCGLSRNFGPHRSYINMMDVESCRVLLDAVYEPHWAHYQADFGKTIAGFFSDEPELGNATLYVNDNVLGTEQDLPWSAPLEIELAKSIGHDWRLKMPLLWQSTPEAAPIRTAYMDGVTRLVRKNFSQQIGDWCRAHGVQYIGHVIEDNGQHCRTGSSLGHYFRGLQGQDWAGIDDIGGQVLPQGEDEPKKNLTGKRDGTFFHYGLGPLAASAAAIEPHKHGNAMCEIFGNYGWGCGVQMQKYLADHFLVQGINNFVPHAFTPKAYPDPDCPPHFYAHGHNPQIRHFGALMRYMNRVADLTSGGHHAADVAILYHGESEWAGEAMPFEQPLRKLWDVQINCDVIPADVFAKPETYNTQMGKMLKVNTQEYKALIVPKADYVPQAFVQAAEQMLANEFPVIFVDAFPKGICETAAALPETLCKGKAVALDALAAKCKRFASLELAPANNRIRVLHYEGETPVYFIVNEAATPYTGTITLPSKGSCFNYSAWENRCEAIDFTDIEAGTQINFTLHPRHSMLVVFDEAETIVTPVADDATTPLTNWTRSTCEALQYPNFIGEKQVVLPDALAAEQPKFSGFVRYETTFAGKQTTLTITDAAEGVEAFVNNQSAGIQIVPPFVYDIASLTKEGENTLRIEVATTLERDAYSKMKGIYKMIVQKPKNAAGLIGTVHLSDAMQPIVAI